MATTTSEKRTTLWSGGRFLRFKVMRGGQCSNCSWWNETFSQAFHLFSTAKFQELEGDVGSQLFIYYTPQTFSRTVAFRPKAGSESETLIRHNRFVDEGGRFQNSFRGRLNLRNDGLEIFDLKSQDAGVYEFKDYNDNLVMTAEVKVLTRK